MEKKKEKENPYGFKALKIKNILWAVGISTAFLMFPDYTFSLECVLIMIPMCLSKRAGN